MTATKVIGQQDASVQFVDRQAIRLVLERPGREFAVIHVKKGGYCKLPGGGIEADEDHCIAGEREGLEETGCRVIVDQKCMVTAEEHRHDLHQKSFCYKATLVEDLGAPELTAEEVRDGLKNVWMPTNEALKAFEKCSPTNELGKYIKERDYFFLKTFLELPA